MRWFMYKSVLFLDLNETDLYMNTLEGKGNKWHSDTWKMNGWCHCYSTLQTWSMGGPASWKRMLTIESSNLHKICICQKWTFLLLGIWYLSMQIWDLHKILGLIHVSHIKIGCVAHELTLEFCVDFKSAFRNMKFPTAKKPTRIFKLRELPWTNSAKCRYNVISRSIFRCLNVTYLNIRNNLILFYKNTWK